MALRIPVALVLFLCVVHAALAQQQPQERKWSELASLIEGRQVQLTLPDAVTIRGEVVGVRNDTLILTINRTTNHVMHPKGHASIPRASVTLIELEQLRRGAHGTLGAILGAAAGVGLYAVAPQPSSTGTAAITVAAVGASGALMGYFIGRNLGRPRTLIKIVP
jgi:hypothetical protein